jgi:3-dehydroquinate synthase
MPHTEIARGALDRLPALLADHVGAARVALVTDDSVWLHHGAPLAALLGADTVVARIEPGEGNKTRTSWAALTDQLLAAGCDRDLVVIGLGGGVMTDLAGFVAATYLRGVSWVAVPTTLLAMVDAAHGGKTGVDTAQGKNLVGAFHDPRLIVIDPDALATLPAPIWRDGFAEVLKHGIIADHAYFHLVVDQLPALLAAGGSRLPIVDEIVAGSIRIKQAIVQSDPREQGRRRVLNFGHTIGHAIEQVAHFAISHGEAVAIGLCVEARIGEALGITPAATVEAIASAVTRASFPSQVPVDLDRDALLAATRSDKKSRRGAARYALPRALGEMEAAEGEWAVAVDDAVVRAAIG